jgi:hypothetical protein
MVKATYSGQLADQHGEEAKHHPELNKSGSQHRKVQFLDDPLTVVDEHTEEGACGSSRHEFQNGRQQLSKSNP